MKLVDSIYTKWKETENKQYRVNDMGNYVFSVFERDGNAYVLCYTTQAESFEAAFDMYLSERENTL